MKLYGLALLLGLALPSAFSKEAPKTLFSDLFVFRTGNSVYSLDNLKNYSNYLRDLKCFYPESLAYAHFKALASAPKGYFDVAIFKKKQETPTFSRTTNGFVGLVKMVRYASSQSVSVSSDLPKAFKLSAQKAGCSLRGFEGNGLKEEMMNLAFVEVFLRSRFAPGVQEIDRARRNNILNNVRSLEESVKNQIGHELFDY